MDGGIIVDGLVVLMAALGGLFLLYGVALVVAHSMQPEGAADEAPPGENAQEAAPTCSAGAPGDCR